MLVSLLTALKAPLQTQTHRFLGSLEAPSETLEGKKQYQNE